MGLELVVSPIVYPLGKMLVVGNGGMVVLGLGMEMFMPPWDGSPAIRVEGRTKRRQDRGIDTGGIRAIVVPIGEGIGARVNPADLGVQPQPDERRRPLPSRSGDPHNPVVVTDIFCWVKGTAGDYGVDKSRNASVGTIMIVRSGNVILNDVWLWRPYHLSSRVEE